MTKKYKKAQQLVEFLLIAPFFVIIFGILTEYAYALFVNMTLDSGLRKVSAELYSQIKPNMNEADVDNTVKENLTQYLSDNFVPVSEMNNITVSHIITGNNAVFIAGYKYVVAFTLPKTFCYFVPDYFNFSATSLVPKAFVSGNNFGGTTSTSSELNDVYNTSNSLQVISQNIPNGVTKSFIGMNNDTTNRMRFLVPMKAEYVEMQAVQGLLATLPGINEILSFARSIGLSTPNLTSFLQLQGKNTYMVMNWDGSYIKKNDLPILVGLGDSNENDDEVGVYSYESQKWGYKHWKLSHWKWVTVEESIRFKGWKEVSSNYLEYLKNSGATNIIIYNNNIPANIIDIQSTWAYNKSTGYTNGGDYLYQDNVVGILKNAVSLAASPDSSADTSTSETVPTISLGNYDNINLYLYRPEISANKVYKTDYIYFQGTPMVVVHPVSVDLGYAL